MDQPPPYPAAGQPYPPPGAYPPAGAVPPGGPMDSKGMPPQGQRTYLPRALLVCDRHISVFEGFLTMNGDKQFISAFSSLFHVAFAFGGCL